MNNVNLKLLILLLWSGLMQLQAQDRTVTFDVSATGVSKPITWGLDLAWRSEANVRRGIAFMGPERVDVIRSSFIPTDPIINGELQGDALTWTNERLNIINTRLGPHTEVVLNSDHPSVHPSFLGNASAWAELIDITTRMHQNIGRTVITVSPFNEPDYAVTGQGTIADFYNIAGELRDNALFDDIRISGGNTLNTDEALNWYNYLQDRLDEGNTHQLAGSFDNYAQFFETVHANGHHATNDELHNVMEAMVGVEYGMKSGIWWGTAEYARGEFVKASDGERLAYAEHRPNWTAASVYRAPDGKVQAFIGGSERQAATTTYRFVSENMDVFFDGHGPQREYTITYPGGAPGSYQNGQTNAEKVINITWGEDIQPVIDGRYLLINRQSGMVMEVAGGATTAGSNIQQGAYTEATHQQWDVSPVASRVGGDFSYFTITAVHNGMAPDIYNWSLEDGGNVVIWHNNVSANQQYYLEYAEDGWFYIRSRHSAQCLEISNASTTAGANIQQGDKDNSANQQWRFLPVDAPVEFVAPNAPTNLAGTSATSPIQLSWDTSNSSDVAGYTIFRAEAGGAYHTIARNVTSTSYEDHTATSGTSYYYKVKAVDHSLNRSANSNVVGPLLAEGVLFDGTYSFRAKHSGKAIDTYNWGTSNGTNIVQWDYWGGDAQRFIVTPTDNGYYRISPVIAPNQALDVAGISTADGANLNTWSWWGSDNQEWRFENHGSGEWKIIARHSQKCLDVEGASTANGANIYQWTCVNGAENQLFDIINSDGSARIASQQNVFSKEVESQGFMSVYPNPTVHEISVVVPIDWVKDSEVIIYDNLGKPVYSSGLYEEQTQIDVSNFSSGIYLVKIFNAQKVRTGRLMIR